MGIGEPIVVVTRQRSGSSLLCDYLAQLPGVVSLGEVLKPNKPHPLASGVLGLSDAERDALHALQACDRAAFWQGVRAAGARSGARPAAKMFYGRTAPDDPLWAALADGFVLHLIRENVLATVVSRKLARRSQRWRGRDEGYDDPVAVTRDECVENLDKLRRFVAWTRARFGRGRYGEIGYDTVCDPAAAGPALARALGDCPPLTARLKRQRLRPLCEVVENYEEVAEFDGNTPLLDKAYDFGDVTLPILDHEM